MNIYELVFITKDGDIALLKNTEKIISSFEGKVTSQEDLGMKQFAYKIKGLTQGSYHVWKIQLMRNKIKELKNKLNLEEQIIRYLLLKTED